MPSRSDQGACRGVARIVGFGIDLLDVARMERELERDEVGFVEQVFCSDEVAYCEARHRPARHYAARFAAKEAVFKALALERVDMAAWRQVEIRSSADGSRCVILHERLRDMAERRGVRRVWLSMTHTSSLAAASVLLES
jgi:holo-[acyl-carrier protein] synthase